MANRAYLYSVAMQDAAAWKRPDYSYLDSRHNIPVSWLFFFTPDSRCRFHDNYGVSQWDEVKLLTERRLAVERFQARRGLLDTVLGPVTFSQQLDDLAARVSNWTGTYLALDPEEIFMAMPHDDEWHFDTLGQLLASIDTMAPDPVRVRRILQVYCALHSDDPQRHAVNIVGCSYD